MATQQDVIKKFMASLDKTTLSGTAALDEAIKACSNFNSIQEVIDKMISDCKSVGNGKNFLLNYCGINLDNDDTGAITGFDAGGSFVKNAEDIVPEKGELINFTGNSFTVNGLTLQLSGNRNFSDLTDNQKFIWQGLYTWWAKSALDLIAESYGNNFGFDSNSSAGTKKIYIGFYKNSYSSAAAQTTAISGQGEGDDTCSIAIGINEDYYKNIDIKNPNGVADIYLDRALAHEFTHAVMYANIDTWNLPEFIIEGMAELTHGTDDIRRISIYHLADSHLGLEGILNSTGFWMKGDEYAAGYMLLRYLAKQSADEDDFTVNTISATVLNGTSSDDKIRNSGDSVTVYSGSNNDAIVNEDGNYIYIDAGPGDDYIYYKSNYVTIYGGAGNDTIRERQGYDNQVYAGDGNDLIINASGTIDGGKGNDTLTSVEGAIFGGESNDLFISASGTINGGSGNDTIDGGNVTKWGRLYQYANGEGADIIIGFNSFDTLEITSGTYSTQKSGDNLIVNVGNGSITLKDIYSNERNKVHIKDAAGNIVTLNDWSIMSGTNGADSLYNVVDNVTIDAMGGNDTIESSGSKVLIYGGDGDDSIKGGATVFGGNGNDFINSGGIVYGENGNDTILSGSSGTIYAGDGNDSINCRGGKIDAGTGNDTIQAKIGAYSSLVGGEGNDVFNLYANLERSTSTINGGIGNDTMNYEYGHYDRTEYQLYRSIYQYANGDGADVIEGFTKYDKIEISGGSYSSVISGNDIILKIGNGSITLKDAKDIEELNIEGTFDSTSGGTSDTVKTIYNTKSDTLISGTNGNDTIISAQYDDAQVLYRNTIHGGKGNDNIRVYLSSLNAVYGDDGNDSIYADINDDITISGGNGNDTLVIEGANDPVVNGGKGNDLVTLRASNSLYQYASGDGNDTIYGLDSNDTVKISGGKYSTVKSGADLKVSVGSGSILLKDVANSAVKFDGTLEGGGSSNETLPAGISIKNSLLTASTKFSGNEINLRDYPNVTKVNSAALSKAVSIVGSATNNSIKGGKGADTISGGSGNDTLTGGNGADIFIYSSGNDIITDYKTGEDKISVNYSTSTVKGSDVILTTANGNLTVKGAKDKVISFTDGSEKIFFAGTSYSPLATGLTYDAKRTLLTASNKFSGNEINLENYLSTVQKINASALSKNVSIFGNDSNNSIKGGKGADTVSGGSGNDTLFGGTGKDIFIYSSGNDIITDYKTGEDKISVNYSTSTVKGSDVILTTANGNLTLKGAKDKVITFTDGSEKIFFAGTSYAPLATGLTYDAKRTLLTASNKFSGNEINLENYLSTVQKVNASALSKAVSITGNNLNNSIRAGKGNDTISGGSGNDTLIGGKGADTFVYSAGKDIITDYSAEDTIQINGTISKTSYSGKNVIFTIGNGSLTVKNGKDKNISITDSSGVNARTLDILEDNNFISAETQLSQITRQKFSVTQIQTLENENPFKADITFGETRQ